MDGKPLTKTALVDRLSEKAGTAKKDTKALLDALIEVAHEEIVDAGELSIPGIGKLVLRDQKARTARNPATGEAITIPAKKVVKFRVSKAFSVPQPE